MIAYKEYFKYLLKESPDWIKINQDTIQWKVALSSQMCYDDLVTRRKEWVVIFYNSNKIISSDNGVKEELEFFYKTGEKPLNDDVMKRVSNKARSIDLSSEEYLLTRKKQFNSYYPKPFCYVHPAMLGCLQNLERVDDRVDRARVPLSSRLFEDKGIKVLSFWQYKKKVNEYKDIVMEYIKAMGINAEDIFYQTGGMRDDTFEDYTTFFGGESKKTEPTEYEKRMRDTKMKAHAMKASLPGKWGQALQKAVG